MMGYFPTAWGKDGKPAYEFAVKPYFSSADPSLRNGIVPGLVISKANNAFIGNPGPHCGNLATYPSGATSYASNFKVFGALNKAESAVTSFDRGSTIGAIPDGAASTIFMAEKYGACTAAASIAGAPTNQGIPVQPPGSGGNLWAEPNLNENAPFFAYPQGGNSAYSAGVGLMFQVQPNPFNQKCNPFRASTPHVGGILVLMGDGCVRTVAPSISHSTWYAAVTADDGERLGPDW